MSEPTPNDNGDELCADAALPPQRVLKSEDLLRGEKEIVVLHRGEAYRLRETRNGKLILQK